LALARGEAEAFRGLDREYRRNAVVVRERLYRDAVDRAIANAGSVRWIPPPVGASYKGLRITIAPDTAGPRVDVGAEPYGRDPTRPTEPPKTPED
jgi:hypothetical protein